MIGGPHRQDAQALEPKISSQQIVERLVIESDVLQPRVAAFVWIGCRARYFKEYDAVIDLIVAHKREGRKRRPVVCDARYRWNLGTMVDSHAQHLAIPVRHGIEVGRAQAVVLEFRMDNNFGIHFFLSITCASSLRLFVPPNIMILAESCFLGIMKVAMELRHLRYFLAVSEALSFTKAAAQLRVAQPALSRQVQDLEDEIGVDLLKRSPRGVTLTAEGKLFLEETRALLRRAEESVEKVRALARGQFGDLHVGYASALTVELLPPAIAAFNKAFPRVNVVLHDLSRNQFIEGLQSGALEIGVVPVAADMKNDGIEFEVLRTYPFCVALPPSHRLARLKAIPLEKVAAEPLLGLRRKDNVGFYQVLDRVFSSPGIKPRVAVECDTSSSLITAIEAGRGIALAIPAFKHVSGKRLVYRPLAGTTEVFSVGIARAKNGDVTPAGEKFCEALRKVANGTIPPNSAKPHERCKAASAA